MINSSRRRKSCGFRGRYSDEDGGWKARSRIGCAMKRTERPHRFFETVRPLYAIYDLSVFLEFAVPTVEHLVDFLF